jgi:hypothetical protein
LQDWSSFPSDHAVLIAALVMAVLFLNRALGVLAAVWAACVVLLPRVYLGLRSPPTSWEVRPWARRSCRRRYGFRCRAARSGINTPGRAAPRVRLRRLFVLLCVIMFDDVCQLLGLVRRFGAMIFA